MPPRPRRHPVPVSAWQQDALPFRSPAGFSWPQRGSRQHPQRFRSRQQLRERSREVTEVWGPTSHPKRPRGDLGDPPYSLYEHADGDEHDRGHHGHHHQGGDRLLLLVGGHHGQEVGVLAARPHVPRVAPGGDSSVTPGWQGQVQAPVFGAFQAETVYLGCLFPAEPTLKSGVVSAPHGTGRVPPRGTAAVIFVTPPPPRTAAPPERSCGTGRSWGASPGGSAAPHPRSEAELVLRGTSRGGRSPVLPPPPARPRSPKRLLHARRLVLLHEEAAGPVEAELAVGVGALVEVGPHRRRHRRTCGREKKGGKGERKRKKKVFFAISARLLDGSDRQNEPKSVLSEAPPPWEISLAGTRGIS